ncbi:MAG TPA: DMT family transporter [Burkholderiaceae bacterium]|nr:DMT family transporter [Burkholderiaceae bacterium]
MSLPSTPHVNDAKSPLISRFVPHFTPQTTGILAAVVTILIWSSFIVIARASVKGSLTPLDVVFMRYLGAAAVLLPWGWWLVRSQKIRSPNAWLGLSPYGFKLTALIGSIGGVGYAMLAYSGFAYAPAAHASVLLPGTLPLSTALVAMWLLKDRITPTRAIGLALILCGDLLVGGSSLLQAFDGGQTWRGDVLFLAASTSWAFYSVLARKNALDAVKATIALTVFTSITYVPVYALLVGFGAINSHLSTTPWGEMLFQAVFQGMGSVVISGISFTKMIQHFGPIRSTMLTALVPGLSALGAVFFLGEPLHATLILGLVSVTVGILFGVRQAGKLVQAAAK